MDVRRLGIGAAAGGVATAAMTAVFAAGRAFGTEDPASPEAVTATVLDHADVDRSNTGQNFATAALHTAFGVAAGALFALVDERLPLPRGTRGVTWGLGVLLISYEGWVPLIGALPPLHRMSNRRRIALTAAHIVYGTTLESTLRALDRATRR
jgi:hypothetical protein